MIFTEPRFLAFFLVVFAIHWALPWNRARKLWLLLTSCAFYCAWDWRFLSLIFLQAGLDFFVALGFDRTRTQRARRWLLALSLVANLGLLGFFKYYNFFVESGSVFLRWLGLPVGDATLAILLPIGISFYTFHTLSYTIDVYRRKLAPTRSLADFMLFVTFFPELVAGPIVRATQFLHQLDEKRLFRDVDVRASLTLFLIGYVKKAVVSDNLAGVIDPVFADPGAFSAASNWLALFFYHVQIYCDFSGYSDMALATAGLLGYTLPKNFDFPFFARNIGEFWQRWHISLSTWFRDYLYVSLGGGRGSGWKAMAVGSFTMMVVGLWHGAGWQYVGFGVLMSAAIVVARLWDVLVPEGSLARRTVRLLGTPLLWWFLFLNWILFRSTGFEPAMEMLRVFSFVERGGQRTIEPAWILLALAFFAVHWGFYRNWFARLRNVNDWVYSAAIGASAALVLAFSSADYHPFIYFQF